MYLVFYLLQVNVFSLNACDLEKDEYYCISFLSNKFSMIHLTIQFIIILKKHCIIMYFQRIESNDFGPQNILHFLFS